jgi:hypothetical protein
VNEPSQEAKQAAGAAWRRAVHSRRRPSWGRVIAEDAAFEMACDAADTATAKVREELEGLKAQLRKADMQLRIEESARKDAEHLAHQQPSPPTADAEIAQEAVEKLNLIGQSEKYGAIVIRQALAQVRAPLEKK